MTPKDHHAASIPALASGGFNPPPGVHQSTSPDVQPPGLFRDCSFGGDGIDRHPLGVLARGHRVNRAGAMGDAYTDLEGIDLGLPV